MTIDFDSLPIPEPSSTVGFAKNTLIRDSEHRDENSISEALAETETRFYLFSRGQVILNKSQETPALFTRQEIDAFQPRLDQAILLGQSIDGARIAIPCKADTEHFEEPWTAYDLRSLLYSGSIDDENAGAIAQAGSMLYWHATNRFCARCGSASELRAGGAKRVCTSCEKEHFPRTDPVVIMLTVDGDRCLLGRSPHFLPGMYSALAGFVEPGETIESAVRRETFEESGIRVGKVTYHATQPWPFPHTLMIGCYGEALDSDILRDESELEDCRWFSREEVRAILNGTAPTNEDGTPELFMPPEMAIANRLIADWAAQDD